MRETDNSRHILEYRFQGYRLDLTTHSLYDPQGELLTLSSRALDTLKLLIENRGNALSKNYLIETIWPDTFVQENNLNQVISSIRKALGDSKNSSQFIKTLVGKGYCFVADLEEIRASDLEDTAAEIGGDEYDDPGLGSSHTTTTRVPVQATKRSAAYAFVLALLVLGAFTTIAWLQPFGSGPVLEDLASSNLADTSTGSDQVISGSIAVLPFTTLATDPTRDQNTFTLGLHDELINQLSQLTSLKIVARDSVVTPNLKELPLQEIGKLLHVESIITGSVMFIDDFARIKLQMLDPASGVITWAYDYDIDTGSLKDMIETNKTMAAQVSQALEADVSMVTYPEILASPTESFEAYRYNMAARRAYNNQDFRKALSLSKQALALDPDYQGALYNFARAHFYMSSNPLEGMTTKDHLKRTMETAERLIELAPDKYEGYVIKAIVLGSKRDWQGAMAEVKRLKKMDAPLWELQPLAPVLMSLGEFDLTIDILKANIQVEPLNGYGRGFLMAAYEAVGNNIQSRMEYHIGEELTPNWWGDVVNFFLTLGRDEKIPDLETFQGTSDEVKALLSQIYDGDRDRIVSTLHKLLYAKAPTTSINVHYAAIAALLDEHELAIAFMKRSTADLRIHLHWIWQPVFRETWDHPDMVELLEENGVLAFWQENGPPSLCQQPGMDVFVCDL